MDKTTVYTKTAKGITQVNQKSASLSKDLMKVLKLIDGKSNFGQIMEKAEMDNATLTKAFTALQTGGFARVFQTQKKDDDPFAGDAAGGGDDFDFTAPGKMPAASNRMARAPLYTARGIRTCSSPRTPKCAARRSRRSRRRR